MKDTLTCLISFLKSLSKFLGWMGLPIWFEKSSRDQLIGLRLFHGRVLSGPVFAECVHGVASRCKSLFAILGFWWDKTYPYAYRPFKLAFAAKDHWRRVNSPHRVAPVCGGLHFKNGLQVSNREVRESDRTAEEEAYRIAA